MTRQSEIPSRKTNVKRTAVSNSVKPPFSASDITIVAHFALATPETGEMIRINAHRHRVVMLDLNGMLAHTTIPESLIDRSRIPMNRELFLEMWRLSPWNREFSSGQCSATEYAQGIAEELDLDVTCDDLLAEVRNCLNGPKPGVVDLVRALSPRYLMVCFSNSDPIHTGFLESTLHPRTLFDQCYFSNETGLLKPHLESFDYLLMNLHVVPREILYFDHSCKCVEQARDLGIDAYPATGPLQITNHLRDLDILLN